MTKYYAIYKGDEFLFVGTRKECADFLDCKVETISFYTTKAHMKRCDYNSNKIIVIKIEEDDEDNITVVTKEQFEAMQYVVEEDE